MDSQTGAIKDKFLAGGAMLILLICYMVLAFTGNDTKFIENALLFMLGVFGGLLKQTASPQTNVASSETTNIEAAKG